jgi:acyl-CoA reductase-like NAD-dependent aldehyde dehydrogenase
MAAEPQLVDTGALEVRNPATLEAVGTVTVATPEAVQEAVNEARLAQEGWAASSFAERRALLGRVAEVLLDHLDEVAETITAETAKPLVESLTTDLIVSLESLVWTAANAERVLRAERARPSNPLLRFKQGWLVYEPLGVVGVISPWNYPLAIPLSQVTTALAAGNAVVLKPSELTPLSAGWIARAFAEAGAPAGLVRVVSGAGETGAALARARGIAKVVFTGSVASGRQVAAAAAERLVPVTLELGGKDPMLVFDDADLERAVSGALWGAFLNCGQTCAGVERIYVERALYEPFVEELARRARDLKLGAGSELDVEIGPLISERQRARVEELVRDAVERGATVRAGGRRAEVGLPGWFYEPTVLTDVPRGARIEQEEIFGPVVVMSRFDGEEAGVRLANDSLFGLGASIWTRDLVRARRVARRMEAGMVWTNDVAYSYGSCQASWGGRKQSGYGTTHSKHGLYELSRVKYIDADSGRVGVPWWFPYDERVADGFKGVSGLLYGRGLDAKLGALWRHRRGVARLAGRYFR